VINISKGYIFIEVAVSVMILSVIFLCVNNLVANISYFNKLLEFERDTFDNISLAKNFFVEQFQSADMIDIYTDVNDQLKTVETYIYKNGSYESRHTFSFKNKILGFGGRSNSGKAFNNELSRNLDNIVVIFNKDKRLLFIKIHTNKSYVCNFVLYLKNKTLRLYNQ
jgi:hypothetical protein